MFTHGTLNINYILSRLSEANSCYRAEQFHYNIYEI